MKHAENDHSGLEGTERLVLDLGSESREAAHLAAASSDFVRPLVEFVCKQEETGGVENGRRKMVLVRFLVNMLGRPLSLLSQHPEVSKEGMEVHPATWATMDVACKCLTRLTSNLITLEVEEEKGEEVESMGLPTLFYWVLGECQQKEVLFCGGCNVYSRRQIYLSPGDSTSILASPPPPPLMPTHLSITFSK